MKFMTTKFRSLLVASLVLLMVLVGVGSAWAQLGGEGASAPGQPEQADEQAAEQADEQAEPVEQAAPAEDVSRPTVAETSRASEERSLPGGMLALAAYLVLWVLIFGLVWMTLRRQGKLNAEIAALERRMDQVFEDFD